MPVILQAAWPPINAASPFINSSSLSGGKGHSWSRWWDKIRLQRKEMGVKVRLQLAYHSLVNREGGKRPDESLTEVKYCLNNKLEDKISSYENIEDFHIHLPTFCGFKCLLPAWYVSVSELFEIWAHRRTLWTLPGDSRVDLLREGHETFLEI